MQETTTAEQAAYDELASAAKEEQEAAKVETPPVEIPPVQPVVEAATETPEPEPEPYQRQVLAREVDPDDLGRLMELVEKVRREGVKRAQEKGIPLERIDFMTLVINAWDLAQDELWEFLGGLAEKKPSELPRKLSFLGKALEDLEHDEELQVFLPPILRLLNRVSGGQRGST